MNYVAKEDILNFPLIKFKGPIHIVEFLGDIDDACNILLKQNIIGFDTETKPAFKKGVSNDVCLLQLSTKDVSFIFRLNKTGLSIKIIDILSNPSILKVGIDIGNDIVGLKKLNFFKESNFLDLNKLATEKGFQSIGAVKLSIMLIGYRISKAQRLSNWESDNLSEHQINYAATDAWICLKILEGFKKKSLFP